LLAPAPANYNRTRKGPVFFFGNRGLLLVAAGDLGLPRRRPGIIAPDRPSP
jgi:hypothetical protein